MASAAPSPVVAGVDGSALSLRATRWAAREADRRDLPLRLVHVRAASSGRPGADERARQWGERCLRAAEEAATAAVPGIRVCPTVEVGDAAEILITHSAGSALVALGAAGVRHGADSLLGEVTRMVTARGTSPVVVHRGQPEHPAPGDAAVVAGLGDPDQHTALGFAFTAAAARACPLVVVRVGENGSEAEQRRVLSGLVANWQERYPDVRTDLRVVRGRDPGRVLLQEASAARLVVVGSRRRLLRARPILDATTHELLDHAPCPVAIIPPDVG